MMVLAIGDGWVIGMWAVQITVSAVMAVVLARVASSAHKFDRLEDSRKKEVDGLTEKLHATATKLIDERFRAMSHELNTHVHGFSLTLDLLRQRLADGDETFEKLSDRDQRIQLEVANKFDVLKDFLRKELVTSEEMDKHERRELEHFSSLETQITNLAVAVNKRGGHA